MENRNPNMTYYIRIIAGGYIIYLGVQLISGYLKGEAEMNAIALWVSAVLFIVAGAYFAGSSLLYLCKHRNDAVKEEFAEDESVEDGKEDDSEGNKAAGEETDGTDELTGQESDAEESTDQENS